MIKFKKIFICIVSIVLAFILGILILNIKNCAPKYKTYEFGMYPQTLVEDQKVLDELEKTIIIKPLNDWEKGEFQNSNTTSLNIWKKYDYCIYGSELNDKNETIYYEKDRCMFCIDIEYNDNLYRGVIIKHYRPNSIYALENKENTSQDENGFLLDNVYWFKYEKITWRILNESEDSLFLMCNSVIDSQPYNKTDKTNHKKDGEVSHYPCTYEFSYIRKWLNDDFYNLAFNKDEKSRLIKMDVDNSYKTINVGENYSIDENNAKYYLSSNTNDFITLLSRKELVNKEYGFKEYSPRESDKNKEMRESYSDYSRIQGHCVSIRKNEWWAETDNLWLTRSPAAEKYVTSVDCMGQFSMTEILDTTNGIVPVIKIKNKTAV